MAKPTKSQRREMQKHRLAPHVRTQAEVKRKLGIKTSNDFYRLFYRCTVTDSREDVLNDI